MIAELIDRCIPFALCVGIIEMCDEQHLDMYLVVPRKNNDNRGFAYKGYSNITTCNLTDEDEIWVKLNFKTLHITHKCDRGIVYEPHYSDFRESIRHRQTKLL